jgi:hypothetical protein
MDTEIIVRPTNPLAYEEFGSALGISGSIAVVGAPNDAFDPGAAYILQLDAAGVTQIARLTASDAEVFDYFGSAVAIDGNYAVVGARGAGANGSGQAYIFHWDGSAWTEQALLTGSDITGGNSFGRAVAMSGDSVIIGAYNAAYVFHRTGSSWVEEAKLTSPAATPGMFGSSVALDGDVAILGDPSPGHHTTHPGEAYVFQRTGTAWGLQSPTLAAHDATPGDHFGHSVAISGSYLVIGAPDANSGGVDCGGVYVFRRDGSWQPHSKLEPVAPLHEVKGFGGSVALNDNYLVVGDPTDHVPAPGVGAAYVYRRKVSTWTPVPPKVTASDASAEFEDWFAYYGKSVAISPSGVLVGAPGATDSQTDQGQAYFYPLPVELGSTVNVHLDFALFVNILFGLIGGGGGVVLRPSGPRPIDPEPFSEWNGLPQSKRDVIMGLALTEIATFIDDKDVRQRVKAAGQDLTSKAATKMTTVKKRSASAAKRKQ